MGALDGLRVGAVSYLNTKPLIYGLDRFRLDVPARLAESFAAGGLDVALLPVFEALRARARAVDNVAIACEGPVFSVIVASPRTLAESETIYLDPASRTSVALLRVLTAEYYPHLSLREGAPPEGAARLLIGDPAIAFQRSGSSWFCHDLGEIWRQHTGLPFVFAVWALAPSVVPAREVADVLRKAKENGRKNVEELAKATPDPDFAKHYLTHFVRFDLGSAEKEAIARFAHLAEKHGLLQNAAPLEFV